MSAVEPVIDLTDARRDEWPTWDADDARRRIDIMRPPEDHEAHADEIHTEIADSHQMTDEQLAAEIRAAFHLDADRDIEELQTRLYAAAFHEHETQGAVYRAAAYHLGLFQQRDLAQSKRIESLQQQLAAVPMPDPFPEYAEPDAPGRQWAICAAAVLAVLAVRRWVR